MTEPELDGCDIAGAGPYVTDDDLPYLALFADVDPDSLQALERRAAEWW